MPDYSSTYDDAWYDDNYVYGYGSTYGSNSIHSYAVSVTVISPSYRVAVNNGTYTGGNSSNTVQLSWNSGDLGDYTISIDHKYYCTATLLTAVLASTQLKRRPVKAPICSDGLKASRWDGNDEGSIGAQIKHGCNFLSRCCSAEGQTPLPRWCRHDICRKCGNQTNEPRPSQCSGNEEACMINLPSLCTDACAL